MTRRAILAMAALLALSAGCESDGTASAIPTAVSVTIRPDSVALVVGETATMSAEITDAAGTTLSLPVQWSVEDDRVATVGGGRVTGIAPRATRVFARSGAAEGSARITVSLPLPDSLKLATVSSSIAATDARSAPGGGRVFATALGGQLWAIGGGAQEKLLDLADRIKGGSHGLYSIAFHPNFATNGFLYLAYVDSTASLTVARYTFASGRIDPGTAKSILTVEHPAPYDHFGGWIGFAPDGTLLITSGDGGPGNSALARDRQTLLGKVLRIDVDRGDPYAIPADNPFNNVEGTLPEIWAIGLRNPWRGDVDDEDGKLYLGDVGENDWEEIDVVDVSRGGYDFGWDRLEGTHCFPPGRESCSRDGTTLPVLDYPLTGSAGAEASSHPAGCSVTAGRVYRGKAIAALKGHFFYADFCAGWVRSFRLVDGKPTQQKQWFSGVPQIIGFGADADGELLILTISGKIYRVTP